MICKICSPLYPSGFVKNRSPIAPNTPLHYVPVFTFWSRFFFVQGFPDAKTEEYRRAGEESDRQHQKHRVVHVVDQHRVVSVRDGRVLQHGLQRQFYRRGKYRVYRPRQNNPQDVATPQPNTTYARARFENVMTWRGQFAFNKKYTKINETILFYQNKIKHKWIENFDKCCRQESTLAARTRREIGGFSLLVDGSGTREGGDKWEESIFKRKLRMERKFVLLKYLRSARLSRHGRLRN